MWIDSTVLGYNTRQSKFRALLWSFLGLPYQWRTHSYKDQICDCLREIDQFQLDTIKNQMSHFGIDSVCVKSLKYSKLNAGAERQLQWKLNANAALIRPNLPEALLKLDQMYTAWFWFQKFKHRQANRLLVDPVPLYVASTVFFLTAHCSWTAI